MSYCAKFIETKISWHDLLQSNTAANSVLTYRALLEKHVRALSVSHTVGIKWVHEVCQIFKVRSSPPLKPQPPPINLFLQQIPSGLLHKPSILWQKSFAPRRRFPAHAGIDRSSIPKSLQSAVFNPKLLPYKHGSLPETLIFWFLACTDFLIFSQLSILFLLNIMNLI